MTNIEIEKQLWVLVKEERRITSELLSLINLAQDKNLYLERGYGSLFDWLVGVFGYSESAAYRRIQAARLLRSVPEVADKIESGAVNLTTLAQAQSAIRTVEKSRKLSTEAKAEIVDEIENKSSAASEKALLSMFPEMKKDIRGERVKAIDEDTSRIFLNISNATLAKLKRVKELLSHSIPNGELEQVIDRLADDFLKRNDPLLKQERPTPPAVSHRARDRRTVFKRAQGACEWRDPESGRVCGSRFQVEIDHIIPKAFGGTDELENLRCLCRQHNIMMAERNLGQEKANEWRQESNSRTG